MHVEGSKPPLVEPVQQFLQRYPGRSSAAVLMVGG